MINFPNRKISDTLLQFAEPLTNGLGPNATRVQLEQVLKISWMIWNAVVYADVAKNDSALNELRSTFAIDPHSKDLLDRMVRNKRQSFADDQRLIGEYEFYEKDGEMRLRAEARDPLTNRESNAS